MLNSFLLSTLSRRHISNLFEPEPDDVGAGVIAAGVIAFFAALVSLNSFFNSVTP